MSGTVFKSLLKYKGLYVYNDIHDIGHIVDKLNKLLDKDETEKYKGALASGWICSYCSEKNGDKNEHCKKCWRGRNGFTAMQSETTKKVVEHLSKVKGILVKKFEK